MIWFLLTLISALAFSGSDAVSKWISRDISDFTNTYIRFIYSAPFFLLIWFFIQIPQVDQTFWIAVGFAVPLEILAWILYLRAIRMSPLSLTIPFLGLTPVFLLIVPWVLMGEKVSLLGGVGVVVVAVGIYFLNVTKSSHGFWGPLKAITHEPGSLIMILVAIIFSFTSTLGKIAITHSSPLFLAGFYDPLIAVLLTPFILKNHSNRKEVFRYPWKALLIGVFFAIMALAHYYAIEIAKVAYMIAVKRTSLIFATLWGWLFFKEEKISERLVGAVIIVIGVFLISVA